tara:strand:- start:19 stop:279 length:261 start_codon:yes stop_codon:yes gene_type:complete
MKEWRNRSVNSLYARRIQKVEFPRLIDAMKEDYVDALITDDGIEWRVNGYRVTRTSIGNAWRLSYAQMTRLQDYIYENDPWYAERQ